MNSNYSEPADLDNLIHDPAFQVIQRNHGINLLHDSSYGAMHPTTTSNASTNHAYAPPHGAGTIPSFPLDFDYGGPPTSNVNNTSAHTSMGVSMSSEIPKKEFDVLAGSTMTSSVTMKNTKVFNDTGEGSDFPHGSGTGSSSFRDKIGLDESEDSKAKARDRARKSRKRKLERMEYLEEECKRLTTENIRLKEQNDIYRNRVEQVESALAKKTTESAQPIMLPSIRDNPATPAELKMRHQIIVQITNMIRRDDYSQLEALIHPHCILFNPGHSWEIYSVEAIRDFFRSTKDSFEEFDLVDQEIQPLDQYGDKFRNRWTISGRIKAAAPGSTVQEQHLFQKVRGQQIKFSGTSIYFFRRNQVIMVYRTWNPIAIILHVMNLGSKNRLKMQQQDQSTPQKRARND